MESDIARMHAALAAAGMAARSWRAISTFGPQTSRRRAYRVELRDGRTVKARFLLDGASAARVSELRTAIAGDALPSILLREERLVVESWIEGEPLAVDDPDPGVVVDAAALLAEIHSAGRCRRKLGRRVRSTREVRETSLSRLEALAERGLVSAARRDDLLSILRRTDPGRAAIGIIHGDFCAENLIRHPSGRLFAVDNEDLAIDFFDYDLGLVWYRWPLSPSGFARFLAAYAGHARRAFGDLAFWKAAAVVKGLWVRSRFDPTTIAIPLQRLEILISETGAAAAGTERGPQP